VDPDNPEKPLPLLRFEQGEKGVEQMSLEKTLHEVWLEPPLAHRINFFVSFMNRESVLCVYKCPAFFVDAFFPSPR